MIQRCQLATPITDHSPGDVFLRDGNLLRQYRGGTLYASHAITKSNLNEPYLFGSGPITELFFEDRPMAASITIDDVLHNADGTKTIVYSDGSTEELAVAILSDRASEAESIESLRKLAAAYWKARSSDFSSSTSVVGKTFQIDMGLELNQFAIGEV